MLLHFVCLFLVFFQTESYPKEDNEEIDGDDDVKQLLRALDEFNEKEGLLKQHGRPLGNRLDKDETLQEEGRGVTDDLRTWQDLRNKFVDKGEGHAKQYKRLNSDKGNDEDTDNSNGDVDDLKSDNGHGGYLLDHQLVIPPDSALEDLVESFHVVDNGSLVKVCIRKPIPKEQSYPWKNLVVRVPSFQAGQFRPKELQFSGQIFNFKVTSGVNLQKENHVYFEPLIINSEAKPKSIGDTLDHHKFGNETENNSTNQVPSDLKRNFRKNRLWPKAIVPYVIRTSSFSKKQIEIIEEGIAEMNNNTCVQWVPLTANVSRIVDHNSYIEFFSERGCWSYVGRVKSGQQLISIQTPWCVSVSTVVHEMCHAIGQYHEQSRGDRDEYITMFWENIRGGRRNNNMWKQDTHDYNPYDAESVLQYSLYAFSSNSKKSMEFKDKRLNFLPGNAKGLDFYDIQDITDAYKCTEDCINPPVCKNAGFLDFKCKCRCPEGLKGPTCEQINTTKCGRIVMLEARKEYVIKSPNYPLKYINGTQCTWLLKAPKDLYPRIEIKDLSLPHNRGRCYHWLEVQYNLLGQTGPRLCGDISGESYTSSLDSGNMMLLLFDSAFASDKAALKGFNVKVRPVGIGCKLEPCMYGGCTETYFGDHTCSCDVGFAGERCDQVVSDQATLTCSFDDNRCFMKNLNQGDIFNWTVNSDSTPSGSTGPSQARSGSKYLYIEASPRRQNDNAIFESFLSYPESNRCLSFWYHMYGTDTGSLQVRAVSASSSVTLFTKSGNQKNQWHQVYAVVPKENGQKIQFEGVRGKGYTSDIAIDDVVLKPGLCPTVPQTTIKTTRSSTRQPTSQTTSKTTSTRLPSTTIWTQTTKFTARPTETTPVASTTTRQTSTLPPSTSTQSTTIWTQTTKFTARPTETTPVASTTTRQTSTLSPLTTTQSQSTTTGLVTGNPVTPQPLEFCSFESNQKCWLKNSLKDSCNWRTREGRTPTSRTGPSAAFEGKKYMYLEASYQRKGQFAVLESDFDFQVSPYCLSFAYHMYGSGIGELSIFKPQEETTPLFYKFGDQGNKWFEAFVLVHGQKGMVLEIKATRGSSVRGDIAIDSVRLSPGRCGCRSNPCQNGGTCVTSYESEYTCVCLSGFLGSQCQIAGDVTNITCTFESLNEPCIFKDVKGIDQFDWTRRRNRTPSGGTGPTKAAHGLYYKYIEASGQKANNKAILQSYPISYTLQNRCLIFSYNMNGRDIGSLIVKLDDAAMIKTEIWRAEGHKGLKWLNATIDIPIKTNSYKLEIVGKVGKSYRGDIAIDDIKLKTGPCLCESNPCPLNAVCIESNNTIGYRCDIDECYLNPCENGGTCLEHKDGSSCVCLHGFIGSQCQLIGNVTDKICSFESGTEPCIFKEVKGIDKFDWKRGKKRTPSGGTGPLKAADGIYYKYIEASGPRKPNDSAVLQTKLISYTLDRCLIFSYNMNGRDIGSLVVNLNKTEIWKMEGDKGSKWLKAAIDINNTTNNYQLEIVGKVGKSYRGDIAIDAIKLKTGPCLCESNPCPRNGVCIESKNYTKGYYCDIDECDPNPCQNGGTCLEHNGGTTCVCLHGFIGSECQFIGNVTDKICSFESRTEPCIFKEVKGIDQFDWKRRSKRTPSGGTGPLKAAEGIYYKYIEASGRKPNDSAVLQTKLISYTLDRCLIFSYNMNGRDMGSLVVNLNETEIWKMEGDKGLEWLKAAIDISNTTNNYRLQIVGKVGKSYRGDIAIDAIRLKTGFCLCDSNPCPSDSQCIASENSTKGYECQCYGQCGSEVNDTLVCTFEDNTCFFKNTKKNDKFDWTLFHSGKTRSSRTGPSSAAVGNKYAFIEASSPQKYGDNAILTSEAVTFTDNSYCLQFEYHQYGLPGKLNVYAHTRNKESGSPVWTSNGHKGNRWLHAKIEIDTKPDLVIEIEATRAFSYRGDIAIDQIEVTPGKCPYLEQV